jgi:transcriptional regulator with XRE-family HTH domain
MAHRIRELRLAQGMTQARLAEAAGVQLDTLRKWERGLRTPLLDAAALLAKGLGVTVGVLAGTEPMPASTARRKKGGKA